LRKFLFYATPLAMACWSTEVLAFIDFGQGRPVTAQDLSGKSFCWNNGVRASYGADGKLSNSLGSGLIDHSQNMTAAAIQIAEK
jgi:hypothetical protein